MYFRSIESIECDPLIIKDEDDFEELVDYPVSSKVFACTYCDKKFPRNLNLQNHIAHAHTHKYRFFCRFCNKGHYLQSRNKAHEEKVHLKTRNVEYKKKAKQDRFTCSYCGSKFTCNVFLQQHVVLRHTHEYKYFCDICNRGFYLLSKKKTHMKTALHSGKGPRKTTKNPKDGKWLCHYCSKIFTHPYSFSRHLTVHEKQISLACKCDVCGKRLSSPTQLLIHKRTHTGERPAQCEHCGKSFMSNRDLNVHRDKIHGDVRKNYKCTICSKPFQFYGKFKRHFARYHPAESIPEENSVKCSDLVTSDYLI